jgi:hypothetical protein
MTFRSNSILAKTSNLEVRRFQHQAQCHLQMHQENFYEYLRFIRNDDRIMTSLEHYLNKNVPESTDDNLMTRIQLIIGKLVEIKLKFGFVRPRLFLSSFKRNSLSHLDEFGTSDQ